MDEHAPPVDGFGAASAKFSISEILGRRATSDRINMGRRPSGSGSNDVSEFIYRSVGAGTLRLKSSAAVA